MAKNAMLFVKARLSFPALFQPEGFEGGPERFSAKFLVPKGTGSAKTIEASLAALLKAAGWKQKLSPDRIAVKDGDDFEYESHQGCLIVGASNVKRPVVINRDKSPLAEGDGVLYAGCWVVAKVELWVQDNKYGKRINAKLHGVQFYADADPFGSDGPASDDGFENLEGEEVPF